MNERNTVIVAVLILIGLAFFSSFGDFTGRYVPIGQRCEEPEVRSNFEPYEIKYWQDPATRNPPQTLKPRCATETSITAVRCRDEYEPESYIVQAPRGYVCVDEGIGGYFKRGSVERKETGCYDSDGNDIRTAGYIETSNELGGGRVKRIYDTCAVSDDRFGDAVTEQYCSLAGKAKSGVRPCLPGEKCSNGACIPK